ncbi:putative peptidyl-prolyl cis-trans isomerase [Planctomycetes bacterium Poly30]|uniref:peptidylprolyl isomerase n=1 Tax=Saltatorellus ferox TaxID=2528018 RepID=A0A518F1A4_9BACT|nr:putative peptidyl-prolyl cis-trans isomerase [Planctomycetes bacterium Poly30]
MAKHKAATEISIAQEERSAFAEFVDQYKWIGLAILGAVSAVILWMSRSSEAAVQEQRADWNALYQATSGGEADAAAVAEAAKAIKEPSVAAIARINQAAILSSERKYGDAEQALGQALKDAPAIFSSVKFPLGPDGEEMTLLKKMETALSAESKWMDEHKSLFENPDLPENAPRVELNTPKGKIVVGLYIDKAPLHAKNFLKLAEEGYYDGTKFHRVQPGGFIQGGDPNSRNDDPASWGTGGPDTKVPQEDSGLVHAEGVLAAAKQGGAKDSSGSQFYLTASPQHQFDGNYVVYGKVLEGLELIQEISNAELRTDKAETPVELVEITKATVVE